MKALIYTSPESLDYCDTAEAIPRNGEQVVDVASVGICGSDMHAYLGHDERRPAPIILGHEVSGTVSSTGARVTINPLVTCGACYYCNQGRDNLCQDRQIISMPPREGGFAEQVAIPTRNLVEIPDHITFDQAALAEPIACGWHGVRLAETLQANTNRALVLGGGAIGVGAALSLIARGNKQVIVSEPNSMRRGYLRECCDLEAVDPGMLAQSDQFEVVVDAVGIDATRAQASALVSPGGLLVHIGLGSNGGGLDVRRMTLQEIALIGTYTYTAGDFRATAAAMFEGRLGALNWIDPRPLSEGARAFSDIRAGLVAAPKIILRP